MNGELLQATSIAFVALPALWINTKPRPRIEWVLFFILVINGLVSFLFWGDPVPHSDIHVLDGLLGRVSMFLFSVYLLFIKKMPYTYKFGFLCCLYLMLFCFHNSTYHSELDWLCPMHISWHMLFHGLIGTGAMFSFI